jgi:hypothetical protein
MEETTQKKEPRPFDRSEFYELQELHRIVIIEKFKKEQVKNNTAIIPDGKKLVKQLEALCNLYEGIKQRWIADKLIQMGYDKDEKVKIDMETGVVTRDK